MGPGSARLWRVGFGVTPKQSSLKSSTQLRLGKQGKVRDREDAIADTRDASPTYRTPERERANFLRELPRNDFVANHCSIKGQVARQATLQRSA